MKFLDPWASFQYLGGALPIHISMAIYCAKLYIQKKDRLGFMNACVEQLSCSTVQFDDIRIMFIAHIFCLFTIIQKFIFTNFKFQKYQFFTESTKVLNIIIYQASIIYIQYVVYEPENKS